VLLNPDAYARPDWLAALAAAAERYPQVRSFTSVQLAEDAPGVLDGLGDVMSIFGIPYRGGYLNPTRARRARARCSAPAARR
jgi:GT2 family glycosyltransferase